MKKNILLMVLLSSTAFAQQSLKVTPVDCTGYLSYKSAAKNIVYVTSINLTENSVGAIKLNISMYDSKDNKVIQLKSFASDIAKRQNNEMFTTSTFRVSNESEKSDVDGIKTTQRGVVLMDTDYQAGDDSVAFNVYINNSEYSIFCKNPLKK